MYDENKVKTPTDLSLCLAKHKGKPISQLEYSQIIGQSNVYYKMHAAEYCLYGKQA